MSENLHNTHHSDLLHLTAEVVSAYLTKNSVDVAQVPELIRMVHASLEGLEKAVTTSCGRADTKKPAVPVAQSVQPDYVICLEDGKRLKMLRRHLRTVYNMTPEQYRAKWNLPVDYPMTAPNYAKKRSIFAKKIGLGKSATGRKVRGK